MSLFTIVAPDYDDETRIMCGWAKNLSQDLQTRKQLVSSMFHLQASRQLVESFLGTAPVRVFIFFGHGDTDKIFGQPRRHSDPEVLIDQKNDRLLRGKIILLVACSAAQDLGPDAVKFGGVCIGFFHPFTFVSKPTHTVEFEECVTVGLLKMVDEGIEASAAKDLMKAKFLYYSDYYSMGPGKNDINAVALFTAFYWDGSYLKIEGDGAMKA